MIPNEIGGFCSINNYSFKEYHNFGIKLNTARNAIEYILKSKEYNKIYLPFYSCHSMLEPMIKNNIKYKYYNIDSEFLPIFNTALKNNECVIIINYFGISNYKIERILHKYDKVIIDNTQAFFDYPIENHDTIYSCRKFFGVTDGAYLYTEKLLDYDLEQDKSYKRVNYLFKRYELSAEQTYEDFKKNEEILCNLDIKKMSKTTENFMRSFNYNMIKSTREENFRYLHENLKHINELNIDIENINGPMIYPFLINNGEKVKKRLIENKIFIATYWPEVLEIADNDSWEHYLTKNLVPLPIDQRYDLECMRYIIKILGE